LVWFTQCIPKHAFVMWMAVQEKLLTQDKIMKWKPNEILKCTLCEGNNDSHSHLFFKCKYSAEIWRSLQQLLIKKSSQDWNEIIKEMSLIKNSNNIWCILRKIGCGAAVYYVWRERNARIFGTIKKNAEVLAQEIKNTIRLKLMSLKVMEYIINMYTKACV
jgi:hypothetical protein